MFSHSLPDRFIAPSRIQIVLCQCGARTRIFRVVNHIAHEFRSMPYVWLGP